MNAKEAISKLHVIKDNIAVSIKSILTKTGEIKQNSSKKELEKVKSELLILAKDYKLAIYELYNQDYVSSETWNKELELCDNLIFIANNLVKIKNNHCTLKISGD